MAFPYGYVSLEELLDWTRSHPLPDGRVIPVCMWGSRGVGKCAAGDTRVVVNWENQRLDDVWEQYATTTEQDDDTGEWSRPRIPLTVLSLDESTGTMVPRRVRRLYRQRVHEMGREVILADGKRIVMTERHRLYGLSGWQRELAPGDMVAIPARLPGPVVAECEDGDLAELLAWHIAAGNESHGRVAIAQKKRQDLERIRHLAVQVGERYGVQMNTMPICADGDGYRLCVSSRAYQEFLVSCGYEWGRTSATKRIPRCITAGSDEVARRFLRAFIAAGGHVSPTGNMEISSASRELLEDLSLLCLRFGIWLRIDSQRARVTNGSWHRCYRGSLSGRSVRLLGTHVGIADVHKDALLQARTAARGNENINVVPVRDLTYGVARYTHLPLAQLGLNTHFTNGGMHPAMPTHKALLVAERWQPLASGEAYRGANNFLARVHAAPAATAQHATAIPALADERASTELRFVAVKEVNPVLLDEWVYDLEIETDHNYIAAGMLTHNTQQLIAYTKERGLDLITYHPAHDSEGSDLVGIPFIDEAARRTTYALPEWLPVETDNGGILFIDEINRGKPEVIQGLMEVLGEGTISQSGWRIPPGWSIVVAGNPAGKDYEVNKLDDAMLGRMLNYAPGWNAPHWTRWAEETELNPVIVNFTLQNPDLVDSGETDLPYEVKPSANPRTLAYFAALYERSMELRMLWTCGEGLLGVPATEAMVEHHMDGEMPLSGADIVSGQWEEDFARWQAENRTDLIRASTTRLIGLLQTREAVPSRGADEAARFLSAQDDGGLRDALAQLAESAPRWLQLFVETEEYGIGDRLPANRALVRRVSGRDAKQARAQRMEERRKSGEFRT